MTGATGLGARKMDEERLVDEELVLTRSRLWKSNWSRLSRDMRFASAFTTEAETDCDTLCSCPATAAFDCGSKDEMMFDTVCANVEAEVPGRKFDICWFTTPLTDD
ncbi:hypothetical protein CDAR_525571 [Caerostris darwini]|uniref:Uncharacterized protein n=1 Tax=Caerostris darwini TaxID=1538125 RepID=A0AAV4VLQ6_9ARAC|nr:hypothetical protein CDAR_525571 [Caerostris darwini]